MRPVAFRLDSFHGGCMTIMDIVMGLILKTTQPSFQFDWGDRTHCTWIQLCLKIGRWQPAVDTVPEDINFTVATRQTPLPKAFGPITTANPG